MIAYLLLFLAGLGIGYAATSAWRWAVLAIPVLLLLLAWSSSGIDGEVMLRFLVGVVLTGAGVLVGQAIDNRGEEPATT